MLHLYFPVRSDFLNNFSADSMVNIFILNTEGKRLLTLLVAKLAEVNPSDPRTFITYKEVHNQLHLHQIRETFGESLKAQGLASLANWTFKTEKPGITGLIIDRKTQMPGKGYFSLFDKQEDDFKWWESEIEKSKKFDWSSYILETASSIPPKAVDFKVPTERIEIITYRIIRDTILTTQVKQFHNYECQLCGHSILLADGTRYAEAHHIQPLGEPHNGPDNIRNIVCVCPNHHAELDYGARPLAATDLRTTAGHAVADIYVNYHNKYVRK